MHINKYIHTLVCKRTGSMISGDVILVWKLNFEYSTIWKNPNRDMPERLALITLGILATST